QREIANGTVARRVEDRAHYGGRAFREAERGRWHADDRTDRTVVGKAVRKTEVGSALPGRRVDRDVTGTTRRLIVHDDHFLSAGCRVAVNVGHRPHDVIVAYRVTRWRIVD